MPSRPATHAEAVFIARSLNLSIEAVWEVIRNIECTSSTDLELAVQDHYSRRGHAAGMRERH
jgi:hypothetical protein